MTDPTLRNEAYDQHLIRYGIPSPRTSSSRRAAR
jgi:hypothetical protein